MQTQIMTVPTIVQHKVRRKHIHLWENAKSSISHTWPDVNYPSTNNMCIWNVSTTQKSEIMILSVGLESMFTYNALSIDKDNSWLITSGPIVNTNLENKISAYWNEMLRDYTIMRDKMCPFMVYEFVNNQFYGKAFNVDAGCIRVQIKDITIWCHPPRFEVLQAVINETSKQEFKNEEGKFQINAKLLQKVDSNGKIPENKKNERKEEYKTRVRESFQRLYKYFENFDWKDESKYTSYRYPTLQLELNKIYPDKAQKEEEKTRYGKTLSKVYGPTANEVHHKFAVMGTNPVPMPTREEIFDSLVRRIPNIALVHKAVFKC